MCCLPPEILLLIYKFSDEKTKRMFHKTCKSFAFSHEVINYDELYREHIRRDGSKYYTPR